jgi:hypothetical protein
MASRGSARVGTLLHRLRGQASVPAAPLIDLGEPQILWIDDVDVIAHPSAWQSTLPNGRIVIAEEFEDGGMWDLWWFPAGSEHGTLRRVRTVDDVAQVADELGFDPDSIRWETTALKDIMRPDLGRLNVSR